MLLVYIVIDFEGILVFDTEVPSGLVPQFLVAEFRRVLVSRPCFALLFRLVISARAFL